jgi:hypothetical protein
MASSVPTPVAAAIGLVPVVFDGVRRLPTKAVTLPVVAVSSALVGLDVARREYDDLAQRGERLLAKLRGTSFDEVEDGVEDALQGTPLAKPYDAVEDALEDAGETIAKVARRTTRKAAVTTSEAATAVRDTTATVPEQEQPKGAPTPKATQPDDTRIDTAATRDVVQTVEQAAAASSAPAVVDHDELPLPDYDHMTLGSLRGRLRTLSVDQLVQLRDYEKAHADRLPVITMLENRIAKLSTDSSAAPSGGDPATPSSAERRPSARGGSKVSPATTGPKQNPPTGGVPTNPAQPRT